MNNFKYQYRIIKSSWGIAIDIDAACLSKDSYRYADRLVMISSGLWGYYKQHQSLLRDGEIDYLWNGLRMISDIILANTPYKNNTLIIINDIAFSVCDFQLEGLTAAIIGWASRVFGLTLPPIEVHFDKKMNKYQFDFSPFDDLITRDTDKTD